MANATLMPARRRDGNLRPRLWLLLSALVIGSLFEVVAWSAETTTYDYDALGRLDKVTKDDGTVIDYDYDAAGNREDKTVSTGSQNSPPVAVNDTANPPAIYVYIYVNVTANDWDPDGDPLTVTAVTQPWNGIVTIYSSSTLRIVGTSAGTAMFTYTVSDGNGGSAIGSVTLTVPYGGGFP